VLENVGSHRACNPAHIVKSEIVGDDAPPTVGTEFYRSGHLVVVVGVGRRSLA
jgi:hypothetical protein